MPLTVESRRRWMGTLAKAAPEEIEAVWTRLPPPPPYTMLRRPEIGLAMVRARVGGDGGPFNLGEMTLTRCSVALADGTIGHAWVAGRRPEHAEKAAVLDALMQAGPYHAAVEAEVTALAAVQQERRARSAAKAGATKVEFFTMVRGEN